MSMYRSSSGAGGLGGGGGGGGSSSSVGVVSPMAGPSSSSSRSIYSSYPPPRHGIGSPLAESREAMASSSQQASTLSLPPTMSTTSTTSIISIPLPEGARVSVQRLVFDDQGRAAQLLQQLKALASLESSLAARRWALSESSSAKGKGRALTTHEAISWPTEVLYHTLWHLQRRRNVTPASPPSDDADANEAPSSSSRYTFTFFQVADLPRPPRQSSAGIKGGAATNEDDLWGDSPAAASPDGKDEEVKALAELAEQIDGAKSSLAAVLNSSLGSSSSFGLLDNVDASQDVTSRVLRKRFLRAIQSALADAFVWRSRLRIERRLYAGSGAVGTEETTSPSNQQQQQQTMEEEDGEITMTEEVPTITQPSTAPIVDKSKLSPRRAVRAGKGFYLLPQPRGRSIASSSTIASGSFHVSLAPPTRLEEERKQALQPLLTATLALQPTHLIPCEDDGPQDVLVLLPQQREPLRGRATAPASRFEDDAIAAAKEQLCVMLEAQTGLAAAQLMQGDWYVIHGDDDADAPFLWPRQLCFSSAETGTAQLPLALRDAPTTDLLETTSQMLKEQQEKPSSQSVPTSPVQPAQPAIVVVEEAQEKKDEAAQEQAMDVDDGEGDDEGDDDGDLFGSDDGEGEASSSVNRDPSPALLGSRTGGSEPNMSRRPSTRGELDDGMYGLVTEDDFAFFDDVDGEEDVQEAAAAKPSASLPPQEQPALPAASPASGIRAPTTAEDDSAPTPALSRFGREVNTAMSTTSGIPSDPSSLPAFTPGSFTDSSPATGGPQDRTPRTPTSPCYDVRPIHVNDGWTPGPDPDVTPRSAPQMAVDATAFAVIHENAATDDVEPDSQRKLKDLRDKYSSGKFALPTGLAAGRVSSSGGGGGGGGGGTAARRNRLGRGGAETTKSRHTLRLLPRADDEMSEAGTLDGSSDESDGSSDEDEEEDSDVVRDSVAQRRSDVIAAEGRMLDASMSLVRSLSADTEVAKPAATPATTPSSIEDSEDQVAARQTLIDWLLDNPFLRAEAPAEPAWTLDDAATLLPLLESPAATASAKIEVEVLETPSIFVGCQGSITEMAPSALRFWDKIGLTAAGGQRKVTALVLHLSGSSQAWRLELSQWLTRLSMLFRSMGLGTHDAAHDGFIELGEASSSDLNEVVDGIFSDVDQREETVRSLVSRFAEAIGPDHHVVLYAVGATATLSLIDLQRDLRLVGSEKAGIWAQHIHVRPFSWSNVRHQSVKQSISTLRVHALTLYNSLRVAVEDRPQRSTLPAKTKMLSLPAFTLATKSSSLLAPFPFTLSTQPHPPAFSRPVWLHVCYQAGGPDDLSFVSIMDEQGKDSTLVSQCSGEAIEDTVRWVSQVTEDYMRRRGSAWRLAIFKQGRLSAKELAAWSKTRLHLTLRCDGVSILSYEDKQPFFATHQAAPSSSGAAPSNAIFVDASQVSHGIYPDRCMSSHGIENDDDDDDDDDHEARPLSLQSSIVNTAFSDGRTQSAWVHLYVYRQLEEGSRRTAPPAKLIRHITQSLMGLRLTAKELRHLGPAPWPMAAIEAVEPALRHFSAAFTAPVASPTTDAAGEPSSSNEDDVMA